MSLLRQSDAKAIAKLLKSYFLELEDEWNIRISFRIVSDRMTPQGMKFKFLFSPGIDVYGGPNSANDAYFHDVFEFDDFAKAFEGTRYQLVELDANIDYYVKLPNDKMLDFWKGSFVVANVYGCECTIGDLTDFDLSYTYPSDDSTLSAVESYMKIRMNPRRNNPISTATLLALGIGFMLGKSDK